MNIFYLDEDPRQCAEWMVDKHVVKMILETAQLLSTAHRELDGDENVDPDLYRKTHKNHPSAKWVRQSNNNYTWTWCLLNELCIEYTKRYGKIHATETKLLQKLYSQPKNIQVGHLTQPPQCMPDEYKTLDYVQAHRNYYLGGKKDIAAWNHGPTPEWWFI